MKGTDLIKKISEEDAFDKNIIIDFTLNDGTTLTGYVETVERHLHDGYKNLHVICRED